MDRDKLTIAVAEAQRFIERANMAQNAFEWRDFINSEGGYWNVTDTRATAAVRRASMDLTRALADLRRPS